MEFQFTPDAIEDLKRLDPQIRQRVLQKFRWFCSQKNPLSFAKPVKNLAPITHRFRVGDYRVLCYVVFVENKIYVLAVKHRSGAYL